MPRPNEVSLPPRFAPPLTGGLLLVLCAAYLLSGTVGHDPWKSDDAIHLGVIYGFLHDGGWLIPKIAGEPWAGTAPLYHWCAAALGWLLQAILPMHDAARLATPLFGAVALIGLSGAARVLHEDPSTNASIMAPLLAIGTLGLVVPLHDAHPAAALVACQALAYWGLALMPTRQIRGGALLGIGLGAGVLADGITAFALTLPLLLVLVNRRWRDASPWRGLALALAIAASLSLAWPLALYASNGSHLAAWWANELHQVTPRAAGGALGDLLELVGWAAWPVWPLAVWALWLHRRRLNDPGVLLPLIGSVIGIFWLATREAQALHALPALIPLILLATAGAGRLRRGAANALDWFGMMTFTLVGGLVWLGAAAMLAGTPAQIAHNFAKLAPGFVAEASLLALLLALAATLGWIAALVKLPRSPWRGLTHWAVGLATSWILLTALWLPWIDYGKTYRGLSLSLKAVLPANAGCIARSGLGLPQRASLDYFAGIRTRPLKGGGGQCQYLLTQGSPRQETRPGWGKVWEGKRPGDKHERLRLYRRES